VTNSDVHLVGGKDFSDYPCGECTLCCKLLYIPETDSERGEYCRECIPGVRCKIYLSRPMKCNIFQCCWLQMDNVHLDLRPDKCNVIFEKINDTLILGTSDGNYILPLIKGQIESFRKSGISVMLQKFNPHEWTCYLSVGADKEEIKKALEDKANDSA